MDLANLGACARCPTRRLALAVRAGMPEAAL